MRQSGAEAERWNRFVESRPESNLCHRWEWRRVFEQAYRWRCHYLTIERSGETRGILPLVQMWRPFGARRLVSVPYLDQGGPLAETVDDEQDLVHRAMKVLLRHRGRSLLLRGTLAHRPESERTETGRARMVLALPPSSEELWTKLNGKVRNQVRKAERSGLTTARGAAKQLDEFYDVYATNMRDLGSPPHTRRFFATLFEAFGPRAAIYSTRDETGLCVAAGIALRHGDSVVVPWASSLREARSACPNHSLYWTILSDCIDQGATSFDFGRSWIDSGTFKFKKQWGAEPVPLRWLHIDDDGKMKSGDALKPSDHPLVTGIWSRLPVPIANRVGGGVRRYLAN